MRSVQYMLFLAGALVAGAGESDQFLVWGVELQDSSEAINRYLNDEVAAFLASDRAVAIEDREELTRRIYLHFFQGLHTSRARRWLHRAPELDRYPDSSVSWWDHQTMSIYDRRSFPFFLPMSRTIRVGDVYCGIDKFGHFFGFGRRFFNHYQRLRRAGFDEETATEKVVLRGVLWEKTLVGMVVDGIFSHADTEAAYQGMRLALDLSDPASGYLLRDGATWRLGRPLDIRPYVTPDFDESYNVNHYWALRKRSVLPALRARYYGLARDPAVQQRFARYNAYPASACREIIQRHFENPRENPQAIQFRAAFDLPLRFEPREGRE
jgi:hypothetical protein